MLPKADLKRFDAAILGLARDRHPKDRRSSRAWEIGFGTAFLANRRSHMMIARA
jgi:hypothetical protein